MKKIFVLLAMLALVASPSIKTVAYADAATYDSPQITQSAKVGQTVRATLATWANSSSQTFAWLLNGKALSSAKTLTLKVDSSMNAKTLQLKQSASVSGETVTRVSNAIVVGKTTVYSQIEFADAAKTTLQVSAGQIFPSATAVKYQWYRNGFVIKGATANKFKFAANDTYETFKASITAKASGFAENKYSTKSFVPGDQPKQYALAWSDEFNGSAGSAVDTSKWDFQEGDGVAFKNAGWGNAEEQWYLKKQATITGDGSLKIDATRNGASQQKCYYGDCKWVSSKLVTYKKVGFQYGRFEARIKGSLGQGVWPAFWLLGANVNERLWPGCGEIDIMELKGQNDSTVWGTLHGPNGSNGTTAEMTPDLTGWHTYAIDWTPTAVTWYLDGVKYHRVTKAEYVGSNSSLVWVFDHEFYIILNLAMGGNFVGGPTDETVQSANLTFDYVRYYTIDGVGQIVNH